MDSTECATIWPMFKNVHIAGIPAFGYNVNVYVIFFYQLNYLIVED